jgi:hypothetical protein
MEKHFELTDETIEVAGNTLHRIRCTRDCKWAKTGDLGGFIEKEDNLSGDAWVADNAQVFGTARVSDNARVSGNAWVSYVLHGKDTSEPVLRSAEALISERKQNIV